MILAAAIVCLLFRSCPTNVPGFVIPVIVDAINGVLWWAVSKSVNYVRVENSEVVPLFENVDAATSIVFEARVIWVVAPVAHVLPHRVNRVSIFCIPVAVLSILHASDELAASTRFDSTRSKDGCSGDMGVSAIALAEPQKLTVGDFIAGGFDCNQSSKALT